MTRMWFSLGFLAVFFSEPPIAKCTLGDKVHLLVVFSLANLVVNKYRTRTPTTYYCTAHFGVYGIEPCVPVLRHRIIKTQAENRNTEKREFPRGCETEGHIMARDVSPWPPWFKCCHRCRGGQGPNISGKYLLGLEINHLLIIASCSWRLSKLPKLTCA